MLGITGMALPDTTRISGAVERIKRHTILPVAVGFGVKTAAQAREIGKAADGVVVGTAIVEAVRTSLDGDGKATAKTVPAVSALVSELASGVHAARAEAAE